MNSNDIPIKQSYKFSCKICDYHTNNKKDYNKHCKTKKHIAKSKMTEQEQLQLNMCQCTCGKTYKHYSSLCAHRRTCVHYNKSNTNKKLNENDKCSMNIDDEFVKLIMELLSSNKVIQEQLLELSKKTNVVNNNTNIQNTFNIDNFLNVTCKDAMNVSDFVNSLIITYDQLLHMAEYGYVKNFDKYIIQELINMDQTKRPIHCVDKKRKKIHAKQDGVWNKNVGAEFVKKFNQDVFMIQQNVYLAHVKAYNKLHNVNPNNSIFDFINDGDSDTDEELEEEYDKREKIRNQLLGSNKDSITSNIFTKMCEATTIDK
jgi:hypothetical protein